MENVKLLFQLYYRPAAAMSEILDRGSWFAAAVMMLIVSFAFFYTVNSRIEQSYAVSATDYYLMNSSFGSDSSIGGRLTPAQLEEARYFADLDTENELRRERRPLPFAGKYAAYFVRFDGNFFTPFVSLSIFYVPLAILLMCIFGAAGNFGAVLQRSYGETATCALTAWTAAHLPFAVAGFLLNSAQISPEIFLAMWLSSGLLFGVFMIFALRTIFGASYAAAIAVVCLAPLAFTAGMYVFRYVSPWLFSPFLLFYAYMYFGGAISGGVGGAAGAFRQKQNFKRFLHNATVNPNDADAHVQLGLIYRQRKQDAKAFEHFNKAFEIDNAEIDANYELGKIRREKGELQAALDHFSTVVEQNDKYALSEIWREIGATYLEAGMLNESRVALEKFVERRPVDSEGLYYLGKVYKAQNEPEKAREMFEQAIESAKISPDYRRRDLKHWSKLAQKEM